VSGWFPLVQLPKKFKAGRRGRAEAAEEEVSISSTSEEVQSKCSADEAVLSGELVSISSTSEEVQSHCPYKWETKYKRVSISSTSEEVQRVHWLTF